MKTELTVLTATQKQLAVEIPPETVEAAVVKVARDFARSVRLPGFRQGKAPLTVVRQRYKDQILHDVLQDLVPRSIEDAMREHALDPVDTPEVRDVSLREGEPLRFVATFETVPPLEPLDYAELQLRRPAVTVADEAVEAMLTRLRERHARYEPAEGRASEAGDTLTLDVTRRTLSSPSEAAAERLGRAESSTDVNVEIGSPVNPPGFDEQVTGLMAGEARTFTVRFPEDYTVEDLRGAEVEYAITVKAVRRKVLPELDDEFAKDLDHDSLEALRERVRADLQKDAERASQRELRDALLRQLASRVTVEVPEALINREIDRRIEEFVRRLLDQGIDPMKAGIDWEDFRARQREAAIDTVKATLMLDEVARRESITVDEAAVDAELQKFASLTGRPVSAIRARLARDGGLERLIAGLRRDRAVEFLLARATILDV